METTNSAEFKKRRLKSDFPDDGDEMERSSVSSLTDVESQMHGNDQSEKLALLNLTEETSTNKGIQKNMREDAPETFGVRAVKLAACFFGLQASYVTWGVLQEQLMTRPYETGLFPSSTFLVFGNRFIAIFVAFILVHFPAYFQNKPLAPSAPIQWFAPCSLSNVLSSWSQYECLKYVSFPVQVVSKSCKIIPVMVVGKLLLGKSYPTRQYVEAALLTLGISIFMLSEKLKDGGDNKRAGRETSVVGVLLIALYLCCDSLTSQWQSKVYDKFKVNQFQMMLGVNTCSIFFLLVTLIQTGEGVKSLAFLQENPGCFFHVFILSLTSCTGQLFIFYTIKKFGPVVFTVIMTIRQMLSMVLSCIMYGHPLSFFSFIGAAIVFSTIGYGIRHQYLSKRNTPK